MMYTPEGGTLLLKTVGNGALGASDKSYVRKEGKSAQNHFATKDGAPFFIENTKEEKKGKTRKKNKIPPLVIPAQAGIQSAYKFGLRKLLSLQDSWIPARASLGRNDESVVPIPAFAGMINGLEG